MLTLLTLSTNLMASIVKWEYYIEKDFVKSLVKF